MQLLFDIGNTSVKCVAYEQNTFTLITHFKHDLSSFFQDLIAYVPQQEKPESVLVSNVADRQYTELLETFTYQCWDLKPWYATSQSQFKTLKNAYTNPQQLGSDRWLAMIAAWEDVQDSLCLIDCGTAISIDLIASSGTHLGGYIIPGTHMMRQSLSQNTRKIQYLNRQTPLLAAADNTESAVTNGIYLAISAAIQSSIRQLAKHSACEPKCMITGGDSKSVAPLLNTSIELRPYLIFSGLKIMYAELGS